MDWAKCAYAKVDVKGDDAVGCYVGRNVAGALVADGVSELTIRDKKKYDLVKGAVAAATLAEGFRELMRQGDVSRDEGIEVTSIDLISDIYYDTVLPSTSSNGVIRKLIKTLGRALSRLLQSPPRMLGAAVAAWFAAVKDTDLVVGIAGDPYVFIAFCPRPKADEDLKTAAKRIAGAILESGVLELPRQDPNNNSYIVTLELVRPASGVLPRQARAASRPERRPFYIVMPWEALRGYNPSGVTVAVLLATDGLRAAEPLIWLDRVQEGVYRLRTSLYDHLTGMKSRGAAYEAAAHLAEQMKIFSRSPGVEARLYHHLLGMACLMGQGLLEPRDVEAWLRELLMGEHSDSPIIDTDDRSAALLAINAAFSDSPEAGGDAEDTGGKGVPKEG